MTRFRFVVDHRDTFEVKRMCDAIEINHKRVARVMAKKRHRRDPASLLTLCRVRTTVPEPAGAKAPDLLSRDFTAEAPNAKYVGDIIYLPLADGSKLYLATVIERCSRKLAGWAIADLMRTEPSRV